MLQSKKHIYLVNALSCVLKPCLLMASLYEGYCFSCCCCCSCCCCSSHSFHLIQHWFLIAHWTEWMIETQVSANDLQWIVVLFESSEREKKSHRNQVQCMYVFRKICHSMFGSRFIFNFGFWSKFNSKWMRMRKKNGNAWKYRRRCCCCLFCLCRTICLQYICTESLHCYQLDWNDFRMGSLCDATEYESLTLTLCVFD